MKRNLNHDTYAHTTDCGRPVERRAPWVGLACFVGGLLMSCAAIMLRGDIEFTGDQQTVAVLACLGMCFISFGVGWCCRAEYDEDGAWK